MNRHDDGPLRRLVSGLRADYPEWVIRLTDCHRGRRLLAYRDGFRPGLYAVITDDAGELRRELDAATSGPIARSCHGRTI